MLLGDYGEAPILFASQEGQVDAFDFLSIFNDL
jgi:hypothetical protein